MEKLRAQFISHWSKDNAQNDSALSWYQGKETFDGNSMKESICKMLL